MMRIMFFMMGLPMMIMSFYEAIDVMPFVEDVGLVADGKEIVLTQEEQDDIYQQVCKIFENAHTVPAFGVITEDGFTDYVSQGKMLSLKFGRAIELMGLPFEELIFKIEPNAQSFDLIRGLNGLYQGRCIHIDLMENDMSELSAVVDGIIESHNHSDENILEEDNAQENENSVEQVELSEEQKKVFENRTFDAEIDEKLVS